MSERPMAEPGQRPIYRLRLRAQRNIDTIKALRRLLKYALRVCGLRAISVEEECTNA